MKIKSKEKVAATMVRYVIMVQEKWTIFMERAFSKISPKKQKWIVCLSSFVFGSYFILVIIIGFTSLNNKIIIKCISSPKYVTQSGDEEVAAPATVSQVQFQKIIHFKALMDSLGQTAEGKLLADSIRQRRPGLLDSVLLLESIYKQNDLRINK